MQSQIRTLGDMTRRNEMTNVLSENTEIERIKNYLEHGLIGRFDLERELDFIRSMKVMKEDMKSFGYIDEVKYCTENMVLSGRYLRLVCYQTEMFQRYDGVTQ
jgi:hypothetical protein